MSARCSSELSAAEGLNEALTLHSGRAHTESGAGGAEPLKSVRFACFQSSLAPSLALSPSRSHTLGHVRRPRHVLLQREAETQGESEDAAKITERIKTEERFQSRSVHVHVQQGELELLSNIHDFRTSSVTLVSQQTPIQTQAPETGAEAPGRAKAAADPRWTRPRTDGAGSGEH